MAFVFEPEINQDEMKQQARDAAQNVGINPDIFLRQIGQESGFNPFAISPTGPLGPSQFTKATGESQGLKTYLPREYRANPELLLHDDRTNPQKSFEAQARHMKDLLAANGGDYYQALSQYHGGDDKEARFRYARAILGA